MLSTRDVGCRSLPPAVRHAHGGLSLSRAARACLGMIVLAVLGSSGAGVAAGESLPVHSQEALRADEADRAAAPGILQRLGHARSPRGNVALLSDAELPETVETAKALGEAIAKGPARDAPALACLDAATVANPFVLNRDHFDLCVLTDARALPARAVQTILRFLRQGGGLIAIGTPAFQRVLHRVNGKWLDAGQIRQLVWDTPARYMLFNFEEFEPGEWRRATNQPEPGATIEAVPDGKVGRGLRVHIPALSGWDGFASTPLKAPFPKDHTLTCFWAKGSERTHELAIEWTERDGSRWIATVPLSKAWRHYALSPQDFRYWRDNPSKGRGGAGDAFNPANGSTITFGLAFTHTQVPPGEHTFWIDEVGLAPNPSPHLLALGDEPEEVLLDTLSPAYRFYPITSAERYGISERQAIVPRVKVPAPRAPLSSHVRPQATGCDKGRPWRWIPLIEASDGHGRLCGFPATLLVHAAPPCEGSAWAAVSYTPSEVRQSGELRSTMAARTRRMLDGNWLLEGGSRRYTCFNGESVALGATVANFGRREAKGRVFVRLVSLADPMPSGVGRAFFEQSFDLTLAPGQRRSWRATWSPLRFYGAPYRVETFLVRDGRTVDSLAHELHIWRPKAHLSFATAHGLDFWLKGRPWYPHGVNYMPSSGIAIEDGNYFEYWLDPFPYDPDVVQTDLERIRAMGMNMVSLFIHHRSIESGNLLDILRRCEELGLRVNLSLRPGTPLDFHWDQMRAIIQRYWLDHNDTVFAYDLAWEPQFGNHEARRPHDAAWERWIAERYGAIEHAEKDWGMPCPRQDGKITNPSDDQVSKDGPWRVMVAAYRRFLDDLLAEHYARARRLIRSVDPNHLVSFRMTIAGDPTINEGGSIPYDFRATAPGVDIVCPEGYGRIGDWDRVKAGAFTVAYARCVAPGRPLMWAEFGNSVWDRRRSCPDPKAVEWTAGFYESFYRMALLSESSGSVCWWYPGGFRCGENSDFGVVNPDGSDRPITKVIRDYAPMLTRRRARSEPKHWITIDRDAHPGGLPAIYRSVEAEFWRAMDAGKFPGLRHEGQGTTSADCPLLAVGNVPYTGTNPPKLLNGLFAAVSVKNAAGQWQEVRSGEEVAVCRGQPVRARIALTNTGFATWLTPKGRAEAAGSVYVVVRGEGDANPPVGGFAVPSDTPYLGEADLGEVVLPGALAEATRIRIEIEAKGRMRFGPTFRLTLRPAP